MDNPEKSVLVGMSGGIDSTATCLMLQEQGYRVVGLTMWVWGEEPTEARELAQRIGVEHHVADEREAFRADIVQYFIDEYRAGRTPNPCVMCNPRFKFRLLCEWADRLGCTYIAGLFPLGDSNKLQVREYLRTRGYTLKADEGESMEVCFVKGDYRDFLKEHSPGIDEEIGPGYFVTPEGVKLGRHKGYPYYTIGQRKGLEIALGKPAYVLKINPQKNTVMLGDAELLETSYMLAEHERFPNEAEAFASPDLTVRIRYRSRPIPCTLSRLEDGRLLVHFAHTASAIAPGQSAVFYIGQRVVGGALIASQRGIGQLIGTNDTPISTNSEH